MGGMTIGMVCLAQTLAHAAIATTADIQGPYCAFVPPIVYALLGTSPHSAISSGAIAALLIADQLKPWSDIRDRTQLASLLALLSGAILFLMGFCRLAFAVRFLSQPTLSGFVTGGSIQIIVQQLRNLFGFRNFPHTEGLIDQAVKTAEFLPSTEWASLTLGLVTIGLLSFLNRLKTVANETIKRGGGVERAKKLKRLSEMKEIIATVLGIAFSFISAKFRQDNEPLVATVGHIPSGLPPFHAPWDIPALERLLSDKTLLSNFCTGALLVSLTSFLTTYATTKKMALKFGYRLDASQEMIALGTAGIAGSFFGAFTPSGSLSRTGLAADCGVKTQLGGIFAALIIGCGLMFLTPALSFLPKATLAAIITRSTWTLIDFETPRSLLRFWRPRSMGGLRRDLVVWLIAFLFTLFLGVLWGIALAVLTSVALIVADAAAPQAVVLGRVDTLGRKWRNVQDWPQAQTFDGILVFEFRGPLSFASAEWFQEELERLRLDLDGPMGTPVKVVVLSLQSVHLIDATALKVLEDMLNEWRRNGVSCVVCGAKHQVRRLLEEKLIQRRAMAGQPPLLDQTDLLISTSDAVQIARRRLAALPGGKLPFTASARQIQRAFRKRHSSRLSEVEVDGDVVTGQSAPELSYQQS